MGRHRYEQRDWGTADGYQFDPRDQLTGYKRDGTLNGDGTVTVPSWNNTNLVYDNNGNRTQVTGVGADTYSVNSLNQYTSDTNTGTMDYDPKGNLTSAAGWTYGYDAQNRLTTMQGPGMTITQTYDPLNRVVTRYVNGVLTQNVWEGWNLIEEHRPDWSIQRCYLQGASQNEMVAAFDGNVYSNHWYWQDGRGNTFHVTGDNAALLERYTYDLSGAPTFYDEWDNERFGGSVYDTRFLFAGSQYLPETGLYDMRNRFYSPTLNRFLQTDPIGFAGDALNLYRYCGNDPVDRSDPMGLVDESANEGSHSSLTSFDHGDWVKGSDGLSDWDRDKRQPAGMDGGGKTPTDGKSDMAGVAEGKAGANSDKYRNTRDWFGNEVDHCNSLPADAAEESGRARPQVTVMLHALKGVTITRDVTSNELANPKIRIPHWSEPRSLSEARRNDIIAQQHGANGHTGIVRSLVAGQQVISVDTTRGGVVRVSDWGFRPFGQNGDHRGDPLPVVRHYIAGASGEW